MRFGRWISALVAVVVAGCSTLAASAADLPTAKPAPAPAAAVSPWSFTVTPYLWLPTLSSKVNLPLPNGGTVNQNFSLSPGQYLPDLRFGFMGAAEADYGRFALLTDLVYTNLGMNTGASRFGEIHRPDGVISIPVSSQLNVGSGVGMLVWTTAGGYSFASGDWGEAKGLVGFRLLNLQDGTNYTLSASIPGPNGGIALARNGSLNLDQTYGYGVAGVTGRFNLSNTGFFVPYYLDAGSGSTPFTWQAMTGLGYRFKSVDVTLGYRYLSFVNSSGKAVENLNLGGAILAAAIHF